MNIKSISVKLRNCCLSFISSYFCWNIDLKLIYWSIWLFINWLNLFYNIRIYGFINMINHHIWLSNELPLNIIYCYCCLVICYFYSLDHVILLLFFCQPLLNFLGRCYFWFIFLLSIFCWLILNFNHLFSLFLFDELLDFIY